MGCQIRSTAEDGGEDGLMATIKGTLNGTRPPKGLSIARSGSKFTLSWKIADKDYGDGQRFGYCTLSATSWSYPSVGPAATSKAVTIAASQFYPYTKKTISAVSMSVKGKRKQATSQQQGGGVSFKDFLWSDWVNKQFAVYKPKKPTLSTSFDEAHSNQTVFSWTYNANSSDHYWTTDMEWQTILEKDFNSTSYKDAHWTSSQRGWQTGTSTSSSSLTISESDISDASYTRLFRARQRGPGGYSDWVYAKHVYAMPYQAEIVSAVQQATTGQGYLVTVKWTAKSNYARPIDQTIVEYTITTPTADLGVASGVSWTSAAEQADTGGTNSAVFSIDDVVGTDECLFVRVNTKHDTSNNVNRGVPKRVVMGRLSSPTIASIQQADNPPPYTATVGITYDPVVPGAFVVVTYKTASMKERDIGIIPNGSSSVVVTCPNWTGETGVTFGVYACVGTYTYTTGADGVRYYDVKKAMTSPTVYDNGSLPVAPATISVASTEISGTIRVAWDWSWDDADSAELSWADHSDAWESTDEPETYTISKMHAPAWNISGLEAGVTWYVRVRLIDENEDDAVYGPWSHIASIDLASAPAIPSLTVLPAIITADGSTTASWAYATGDGTTQANAVIAELTIEDDDPVYTEIAKTESAQHVTINAQDVGWQAGETHNLVVRVTSASGKQSDDWSQPVPVIVAEPVVCAITANSLETVTLPDEREVLSLTEMPMTLTVTGAGSGGTTIVAIERAEDYQTQRPDDTRNDGFEGETVCLVSQTGEAEISIDNGDLVGFLDDGAQYRLVATVMDGFGQTDERTIDFEVHWEDQAIVPDGTVTYDDLIAIVEPVAPTGATQTSTCDIYRLSVDRPEKIAEGVAWGTEYVDPYPTVGEFGGYRFVYVTKNGDYITDDNTFAWTDITDYLDEKLTIIDFGSDRAVLGYDIAVSGSWAKDFKQTTYLGGSIQGDWNSGVSRTGSVSARTVILEDPETIQSMRRLAVYAGICHVRTPDGSSYAADVQVTEKQSYQTAGKLAEFDVKITRVDPEGYDAIRRDLYEVE